MSDKPVTVITALMVYVTVMLFMFGIVRWLAMAMIYPLVAAGLAALVRALWPEIKKEWSD